MGNTPLNQLSEYQDQCLLAEWLSVKGYKHTSIPNSTFTKSWAQKLKNKRQGLHAGFPDMVIIKNGTLLLLELKRVKGGVLSDDQKDWLSELSQCTRIRVEVAHGFDDALSIIESL